MEALELARRVREALLSKKGDKVMIFDVRGKSSITDYYVIASGATGPQLKAMTTAIVKDLKGTGEPRCRLSGTPDDGWIVVDCIDVVIHVLLQDLRDYYAIEDLWADSPQVE